MSRHRSVVEGHVLVLEHALPPVEEPDDLVAVDGGAGEHHGPDHGVQPGAVPAAGQDPDAHRRRS